MDGEYGEPAADSVGSGKIPLDKMPKSEKIDFHFNDILRVYPDQIPMIIKSFEDWARQFK